MVTGIIKMLVVKTSTDHKTIDGVKVHFTPGGVQVKGICLDGQGHVMIKIKSLLTINLLIVAVSPILDGNSNRTQGN